MKDERCSERNEVAGKVKCMKKGKGIVNLFVLLLFFFFFEENDFRKFFCGVLPLLAELKELGGKDFMLCTYVYISVILFGGRCLRGRHVLAPFEVFPLPGGRFVL